MCALACRWSRGPHPLIDIRLNITSRIPVHRPRCSPLEWRLACSDAALCLAKGESGIEAALKLVHMAVEPSVSQMATKTAAVSAAIALLARHRLQLRRETGAEDTAMSLLYPLTLHKDAAWDYSAVAVRQSSRRMCRVEIIARILNNHSSPFSSLSCTSSMPNQWAPWLRCVGRLPMRQQWLQRAPCAR
jgi:hypothetical protein